MKLHRLFLFLVLISLMLIPLSCGDKSTSNEPDTYVSKNTFPLTTGSWWHYEGFVVRYDNDTLDVYINRYVIGPDSTFPVEDIVVLDDSIWYGVSQPVTNICRKWIKNVDDKAMIYAEACALEGFDHEPVFYDEPIILLDLPLDDGKEWTNDIGDGHSQNFSVVGTEYMEIDTGWRVCDVVYADVINDSNGDIESSTYKWYCDDGLMRSQSINRRDYGGNTPPALIMYKEFRVVDKNIVQ